MGTRYGAYVLRHWQLADGQERIEVQQIATGATQRYRSLDAAYGWITAQIRSPPASTVRDETEDGTEDGTEKEGGFPGPCS